MNKAIAWLKNVTQSFEFVKRQNDELIWSQIYNSTVQYSDWFRENISPGRWAVGYPLLYILYRILDEQKPKCILELGLGQSSKLTCSYTHKEVDVEHIIVDHNQEWIDFFGNNISHIVDKSTIIKCDLQYDKYDEHKYYKDFEQSLPKLKYDLILIDAPNGSKVNSRIDVLNIIPDRLADDFVIIVDDCDRLPEQETYNKITRLLFEKGISYSEGIYSGLKDVRIIVSENKKFLCTL